MEAAVVVAEETRSPVKAAGEGKEKAAGEGKEKAAAAASLHRRNRIQVSSKKKPVRFYVSLAKRIMEQHNEVVLSALGTAIGTVVKIAVILKTTGLATEKSILTSTVELKDESSGRNIQKARIEILLGKTEEFNGPTSAGKAGDGEEPEDHKDC